MNVSTPEPGVWVESSKIHSYQVDFKQHATMEALCRLLQEAAWNHAEALGVGFSHLAEQSRFWVLSRFALEIETCPRWNDEVVLHTWPRAAKSVFAMRDFEMGDAHSHRLCAASSAWLVLDSRTRKPLRPDKWLARIPVLPDKRALVEDPAKLSAVDSQSPSVTIPVKYSDIDVNHHVTYSRYVGMMLDSYSLDFHAGHSLSRLEINFLGETRSGEILELRTSQTGAGGFYHNLVKAPSGEEVCRGLISWRTLSQA